MGLIRLQEQSETKGERLHVTLTSVCEMKGKYPNIPLPDDVDRKALGEGAFFVTLPIGQVNARSRNGRTYTRKAVTQLAEQINAKRPEGSWGHTPDDRLGTAYEPPALRWLAAEIDADGVVWGKALPLTEQARDYYRLARATNARVGTSLQAWATMDGENVAELDLIKLDAADPGRVGIPMTAARPEITMEMLDLPQTPHVDEGDAEPGAKSESQAPDEGIVADEAVAGESAQVTDAGQLTEISKMEGVMPTEKELELTQELATHKRTVSDLEKLLKEQRPAVEDLTEIRELLKAGDNADVVKAVRVLQEQYADLAKENSALLAEAMDAMIAKAVKPEATRPMIRELVAAQKPITRKQLERALDEVLNRESVKSLLAAQVALEMGPNHERPADKKVAPAAAWSSFLSEDSQAVLAGQKA